MMGSMVDNFAEAHRLLNAALALIAFVALAVRINDDWKPTPLGWRIVFIGLLGFVFTGVYGSVEVVLSAAEVPVGVRTWMFTLFAVLVDVGLWMVRSVPLFHAPAEWCVFPGCVTARLRLDEEADLAEAEGHGVDPDRVRAIVAEVREAERRPDEHPGTRHRHGEPGAA